MSLNASSALCCIYKHFVFFGKINSSLYIALDVEAFSYTIPLEKCSSS